MLRGKSKLASCGWLLQDTIYSGLRHTVMYMGVKERFSPPVREARSDPAPPLKRSSTEQPEKPRDRVMTRSIAKERNLPVKQSLRPPDIPLEYQKKLKGREAQLHKLTQKVRRETQAQERKKAFDKSTKVPKKTNVKQFEIIASTFQCVKNSQKLIWV